MTRKLKHNNLNKTVSFAQVPRSQATVEGVLKLDIKGLKPQFHHDATMVVLVHYEATDYVTHPRLRAKPGDEGIVIKGPLHL